MTNKKVSNQELKELLMKHQKWLKNEAEGERLELVSTGHFGKDFTSCNFEGADLRKAKFIGLNLKHANFQNADLREADLFYSNLTESNLKGANLKGASLVATCLVGAVIRNAQLDNCDLFYADFENADCENASFRNCKIGDGYALRFSKANLEGADFTGAKSL